MERQDFLPRAALPGDNGLRDLPPSDRILPDSIPTPRMDLHHGDDRPERDRPEERCDCGEEENGICVGYEGCGEGSWGLTGHPLAMVYSPCQAFRALYDPATALNRGTLFTELDLPFGGAEGALTTVGCACRVERRGV